MAALGFGCALAEAPAEEPLPATIVKIPGWARPLGAAAEAFTQQTGIALDLTRADKAGRIQEPLPNLSFWNVVESMAKQSGHRLSVSQSGIALLPGFDAVPASVAGPFRTSLRQATVRRDFESNRITSELTLDIAWEPTARIFLLGIVPASLSAIAADGKALQPLDAQGGRQQTAGTVGQLSLRFNSFPGTLKKLDGKIIAVGTRRMLDVELPLTEPPGESRADGVTVRLRSVAKRGQVWEVDLQLLYPEPMPEFESFQSWTAGNRLELVTPTGKTLTTTEQEFAFDRPTDVTARYFFPASTVDLSQPAGWKVRYRTPGRIVETTVPFAFSNLPLP